MNGVISQETPLILTMVLVGLAYVTDGVVHMALRILSKTWVEDLLQDTLLTA